MMKQNGELEGKPESSRTPFPYTAPEFVSEKRTNP
jgi:hypothetical protein